MTTIRPATLVLITGQLGLGGAEQQAYHLLSALDRARFRPIVISLGPRSGEYWESPIQALGVPIRHISKSLGRAGRLMRIAHVLRAVRADIVHAWAFHANSYAAFAGKLARIPVRLGSVRESCEALSRHGLFRWTAVRGLDGVVVNSYVTAAEARSRQLTKARVHVVRNGVSIPAETTALARARARAELGISPQDVVIGTVGRLDENKNQSMLIRSVAPLARTRPQLRLLILGEGPLRSRLVSEAAGLGIAARVLLPGAIPSAAAYLPAMDICCLTSRTEGMPNLLMEASARGLPIVATDAGGSRELVETGVTGFLVPRDDERSLTGDLEFLLEHPTRGREMGLAGRAKMRREFGVDAMATAMSDVYASELTRKMSPGVAGLMWRGSTQ
jgi:glycosyltransferase involved in cell wall biosynthesis